MRTIVIGLGNPILGDDGVGWKVAQAVLQRNETESRFSLLQPAGCKEMHHPCPVEVECVSLGGLSLMERLIGYDRAILIDAMQTGQRPVGTVHVCTLEDLPNPSAGHSTSAHDTSLMTALEIGRRMGLHLPSQIDVVAIEAEQVYNFSEDLSPPVAAAIPQACQAVLNLLKSIYDPLEHKESA